MCIILEFDLVIISNILFILINDSSVFLQISNSLLTSISNSVSLFKPNAQFGLKSITIEPLNVKTQQNARN